MGTIEEAVYLDCETIWNLNDFESEKVNCDCADLLHVWLHVLDPSSKNFPEYKKRKAESALGQITNRSKPDACLECGHKWTSANCTKYIDYIVYLLEKQNYMVLKN